MSDDVMKVGKGSHLQRLLNQVTSGEVDDGLIIPHIERYLDTHPHSGTFEVHDVDKPKDKYFHPSTDCEKCPMLLFFERCERFNIPKEEFSPGTKMAFKIGHAFHALYEHIFDEMGKLPGYPRGKSEVLIVNDDLNIKGSADYVLEFPGGKQRILDFKTIDGQKFKTLKSPSAKYLLQLRVYMALTGIDEGILLYISKGWPHDMKEFKVEPGDISTLLRRWGRVQEALIADDCSILSRECRQGSTTHSRCPAKEFCFSVKR